KGSGPPAASRLREIRIWTPGHDLFRTLSGRAVEYDRHGRSYCRRATFSQANSSITGREKERRRLADIQPVEKGTDPLVQGQLPFSANAQRRIGNGSVGSVYFSIGIVSGGGGGFFFFGGPFVARAGAQRRFSPSPSAARP